MTMDDDDDDGDDDDSEYGANKSTREFLKINKFPADSLQTQKRRREYHPIPELLPEN